MKMFFVISFETFEQHRVFPKSTEVYGGVLSMVTEYSWSQ